ncbi:hypothetical protein CDO73_01545 [Saccharibacillus sp. O23]|uniref:hypothetical protein n=1 Tax=Saccharibacillus sp. O23 TaxID=2009338 RepID=UPI000B4E3469|nr:hypothetical protein [Saccharibacillus sp. O23]OWR32319.1 hypothetical protein CDO73_01545 [Saccharibacillus sp. O23]
MKVRKGILRTPIKLNLPYRNLNLGLIKEYSMIVPKAELCKWKQAGWAEDRLFTDFNYYPDPEETLILNRPQTLLELDIQTLKGKQILGYSTHLGTYGMGGPGFFGLLIDRDGEPEYLVYAVWSSDQYTMMDHRVIGCHIRHNATHRPWISRWTGESEENQWDELTDRLIGSTISEVSLSEARFDIEIMNKGQTHKLTFYRYSEELPPQGNGEPRKPAFTEGTIGSYIVFCHRNALLHV